MADLPQLRNGFMKMTRLGPIKPYKQDRSSPRVPARRGFWAFPWPYYDEFYTYHRYRDAMPKRLQKATDPSWYRDWETDEPLTSVEFDHEGYPVDAYLSGEFYDAQQKWLEDHGRRVVRKGYFWYSGDLYAHIRRNGEILDFGMQMRDPADWEFLSVSDLHKAILKTRGNKSVYWRDGRPIEMHSSVDHLEVFIPSGAGIVRSTPQR